MIHCCIVDDEPLARKSLERLLAKEHDFQTQFSTGRPKDALRMIVDQVPDVVFLDIKMPGLDGITLLRQLANYLKSERTPIVVLVTAFDDFAVKAYEYDALDYLLKPFNDSRFQKSLRRIRSRVAQLNAVDTPKPNSPKLRFKVRQGEVFLDADEICWVEASGHYVFLHTQTDSHLVRMGLSQAEKLLMPNGFVRVHRSALVNKIHILRHRSQSEGGRIIELSDGRHVAISRRRWRSIRDRI